MCNIANNLVMASVITRLLAMASVITRTLVPPAIPSISPLKNGMDAVNFNLVAPLSRNSVLS